MGERTSEVSSPDPFNSFPPLRVPQSDFDDASPSSRYSSCGDSEFDRYCSANSVMGTPSVCSTITVFNDFADLEFGGSTRSFGIGEDNGLENFSLGGKAEINRKYHRLSRSLSDLRTGFCGESNRTQQNLRYGSSGLELCGDDNEGLVMTTLDASGLMGFNQLSDLDQSFHHKDVGGSEVFKGHNELVGDKEFVGAMYNDGGNDNVGNIESCVLGNVDGKCSQSVQTVGEGGLSCAAGRMDQLNAFDAQSKLQIGRGEMAREGDGNSSTCEHSEGEDSTYNYGTDDDNKNESDLSRNLQYHQNLERQSENPLLVSSSVAFGSEDLDDFLLENGRYSQGSAMSDLFHKLQGNPYEVEGNPKNLGSVSSMGSTSAGQKEKGKEEKHMFTLNGKVEEIKDTAEPETVKEDEGTLTACCQVQGAEKFAKTIESFTQAPTDFPNTVKAQLQDADILVKCSKTSNNKTCDVGLDLLVDEAPQHMGLNVTDGGPMEKWNQYSNIKEAISTSDIENVQNPELDNSKFRLECSPDGNCEQNSSSPINHFGIVIAKSIEKLEQTLPLENSKTEKTLESSSTLTNLIEKSPVMPKVEDFELNEFYNEVVQDMEEILLDSMDSPGTRLAMGNRLLEPQLPMPLRDGGLTASTSSTDDAYLLVQCPAGIERIEVVGARQKKGDVSFSERLVGVKEYTVYKIKVWSGKDQWEVERRYRDFLTLCRCINSFFSEQGWILPLPLSCVEKETKKIFRSASPDVIARRSVLIQECLRSILHTRFFSSPPRALIWFLSPQPQDSYPVSPSSNAVVSLSSFTRGTTISLIVEIPPNKSTRQMLEAQHNTCAGCHKHFDDGRTVIWDFVQTFGWGKPRLCEYTGQLFCSSCHTNETAVLPARVLHHWDFTPYPVSQLAKSYLDSINEQPMLCVTAVNPFLLSKVPALRLVMSIRKKIGTILPYVHCPFWRSINRGLGNRRYFLESSDFFALRDLIDLSKGVFAALPVMVETLSRKILEHITDQCLICCDVGVPCSARQDCSDPSSLIFPFQEDEIERCKACESVFHKACFRKLASCPCGAHLILDETRSLTNSASQRGSGETRGTMDLLGRRLSSGLSSRFLSGLFTKEKPRKTREHKDENIILMGSLPSTL